ncbi:MAG TPA: hypothetical protein VHF45_11145 [Thermoleophilaceae bacterium]|nr:hypothetical protein [Thermoleophilaceae bacterium]
MIVRIASEGQFRLGDDVQTRLNELDNEAVAAVEQGDEPRFHELFGQMIALVEGDGEPVADDELIESDVIIPPKDLTFEEAKGEFTGEGIVPD